jgi:hypothetical protein
MSDATDFEQHADDDLDRGPLPGPAIESSDGLSPGQTSAVRVSMIRSPILAPPQPPMHPHVGPSFELIVDRRSLALHAMLVIAAAAPFVVLGLAGLGFAVAASTSAILGMRRISRGVHFGFGDGFVGYRGGLGWPRGVQEEYDVTWGSAGRRPTANQA